MKKRSIIFVSLAVILVISLVLIFVSRGEDVATPSTCEEGTCLENFYCESGVLVEKASVCGCPENFSVQGEICFSEYMIDSKEVELNYVLRGKNYSLDYIVYGGVVDYLESVDRITFASNGEVVNARQDFKLKTINDPVQEALLRPLVYEIMNAGETKEDEFRIAVSLVQNIEYSFSNKTINFRGHEIQYSRFPYEVLYSGQGVCEEKTALLLFLLRELGYDTAGIYYPLENHEALGVFCPIEESLDETGYCFVETTGPSIITNNKEFYSWFGYLSSVYDIYEVSSGEALPEGLEEYKDADTLKKINSKILNKGYLNPIQSKIFRNLKEKYGLN